MPKVQIVTRNAFGPELRKRLKWWQRLFIQTWEGTHYWSCVFTPWRLFAIFFVKDSKYYKARIEPW